MEQEHFMVGHDAVLEQVTEWVLSNEVKESANQIQKWMKLLIAKKRGRGPRKDVLTSWKAVTLRGGQRKIASFFPQ